MFQYELILQDPDKQDAVLNAARDLAAVASFTRLRGSFAYANQEGAQQLTEALRDALPDWDKVLKRWLISFDFGFTDPRALDLLASQRKSKVRIPDGDRVLSRKLAPRTCFHAKSLLLDARQAPGSPPVALLVGSANLTVSGMRQSTEHVTAAAWVGATTAALRSSMHAAHVEARRFEKAWSAATPLDSSLLDRYTKARRRVRRSRPWRDEDDRPPVRKLSQSVATRSLEKAAELMRAKHLWVEAGKIVENLGSGNPGNQVDLSPGTRVFFGFSNKVRPTNTPIGSVFQRYHGQPPIDCHMRFADNSMDRLNLPHPGTPGPPKYDYETLLFSERGDGSFDLKLGTVSEVRVWKKRSRARGTFYKMQKGRAPKAREWGVF